MCSEPGGAPSLRSLEAGAAPVSFPGLVAHWPALHAWAGEAGLQRLAQLAGAAHVEALATPAGARACGSAQHLVLLGCTLRELLEGALARQLAAHAPPGAPPLQLYLAQSPMLVAPPGGSGGGGGRLQPAALAPLMADVEVPPLLQGAPLSQVNFWASMGPTRGSLHYDPYSNLLCVARGSKTALLLPPSAAPALVAQPLTAESANHSPADLSAPDFGRFPGLEAVLPQVRRFQLAAGDALFIPEGWWHQVDSGEGTLAVNFWWDSAVSRQLGGHMDRYYLRRLLQGLVEQEKAATLAALPRADLAQLAAEWRQQQQHAQQQQAAAADSQEAAARLESGRGGAGGSVGDALPPEQAAALFLLEAAAAEHKRGGAAAPPPPLVCTVVATLAAQSPQALLDVLLRLRRQQPGLAAHLLLHSLDAAGWELLAGCMERRQEELAAAGGPAAAEAAVGATCEELYSAVGDRPALLEAILQRKAEFARRALQAVLAAELAGCL